jgi:hypothetical protein
LSLLGSVRISSEKEKAGKFTRERFSITILSKQAGERRGKKNKVTKYEKKEDRGEERMWKKTFAA